MGQTNGCLYIGWENNTRRTGSIDQKSWSMAGNWLKSYWMRTLHLWINEWLKWLNTEQNLGELHDAWFKNAEDSMVYVRFTMRHCLQQENRYVHRLGLRFTNLHTKSAYTCSYYIYRQLQYIQNKQNAICLSTCYLIHPHEVFYSQIIFLCLNTDDPLNNVT